MSAVKKPEICFGGRVEGWLRRRPCKDLGGGGEVGIMYSFPNVKNTAQIDTYLRKYRLKVFKIYIKYAHVLVQGKAPVLRKLCLKIMSIDWKN